MRLRVPLYVFIRFPYHLVHVNMRRLKMRVRTQLCVFMVAAVAILGLTTLLQGDVITQDDILVQGTPTGAAANAHTGTVGDLFQTSGSATVVRALGFWDEGGDGLTVSHDVGIWNASVSGVTDPTPLASVSVPSGTSAPLYQGYRWVNLATPVTLTADKSFYTIGAWTTGSDGDGWHTIAASGEGMAFNTSIADANNISSDGYADGRYGTAAWPAGPSVYGAAVWAGGAYRPAYVIANLSTAAIPEPGTLVLLATGLIALLAYAWRKRK